MQVIHYIFFLVLKIVGAPEAVHKKPVHLQKPGIK